MNVPDQASRERSGAGYAYPQAAREQPPEKLRYVAASCVGTG